MLPDTTMEETIPPPETIVSITYGDFQNLLNRLSYLETIQDEAKNHVTELISDSQQKNARFHTLETAVASIGSTTATPREGEPKVADPEPFCGDRLKLLDFLAKCQLKFLGQPSHFSTEKSKIIYAGALLEKEAFSWFQPHFIKAVSTGVYPPEIIDFKAMSESLTALYGDPDIETSSENALRAFEDFNKPKTYLITRHNSSVLLNMSLERLALSEIRWRIRVSHRVAAVFIAMRVLGRS